jgi:flavodoxin
MIAWVVYDSVNGNTEKIAKSIGASMSGGAKVIRVAEANPTEMDRVKLLVVGSPTYGGRPTEPIQAFLTRIPPSTLKGMHIATFDTRLSMKFARLFGYAADKISRSLIANGATQVGGPEGFIVEGREGPLARGELERSALWGRRIAGSH